MTRKRILLVEDREFWRSFVSKALSLLDVELVTANTYGEGLQALQRGPYDLCIFDNTLGDIRNASVDLIQIAIRWLRPLPPIIVHSADLPSETERQITLLDAEYIEKHQNPETLKHAVERLLAS